MLLVLLCSLQVFAAHDYEPETFGIVTAVVTVCGLALLWLISRFTPKETVLVIAVMISIAGWMMNVGDSSMKFFIAASLRSLGTLGIILGLIDWNRERELPKETDKQKKKHRKQS